MAGHAYPLGSESFKSSISLIRSILTCGQIVIYIRQKGMVAVIYIWAFCTQRKRIILDRIVCVGVHKLTEPGVLEGDFSEILSIEERLGCTRANRIVQRFKEWAAEFGLIDLPLSNIDFTWFDLFSFPSDQSLLGPSKSKSKLKPN